MEASRTCIKCKLDYTIVGRPGDIRKLEKNYKCYSCQDAEMITKIRTGLKNLIDPDTGKKYSAEKIELRVTQWLTAKQKWRTW